MSRVRATVSRWFLPLLGVLLGISTLVLVGIGRRGPFGSTVLEGAFALVLAAVLSGVGYRYYTTTDLPETDARTVAMGVLGGFGLLAVMNLWFRLVEIRLGERDPLFAAVTTLTAGTLGGAIVGIAMARSRRRYAEREKALADYKELFETAQDAIFIDDPETGTVLEVNERAVEMLGYDRDELEGMPVGNISADDPSFDQERAMEKMQQAIQGDPQQFDWLLEREDGTTLWVEVALKQTTLGTERRLIAFVRDISERKRHERQIAALHNVTREMVQSTDERAVCETAVRTADSVLDFPVTGVWLADESGDRLEPVAVTEKGKELFDEPPTYTAGNSLSWQAFSSGESMVFDDVQSSSVAYNPDTKLRSELIVPLGEHGVLNTGATEPAAFTDSEVDLIKLLAANTRVALDRVDREHELEKQTHQMEFFNSILRHDVLNGITVIRGRAELLTDELEGQQLKDAETIVSWSDDITEIVQRVRTILETLTSDRDAELEVTDLATVLRDELDRVRSTYPEVTFDTSAPDTALVSANELLGDVLGNVVTNAVQHNDTDDLSVSITVEESAATVTVRVADDGQGIDDDQRDAVFRRGETGHAKATGSGFGLFFVDAMMEEYGGDVRVTDNDAGGATFVLQFRSPDQVAAA